MILITRATAAACIQVDDDAVSPSDDAATATATEGQDVNPVEEPAPGQASSHAKR
jgi:hypothetical protein